MMIEREQTKKTSPVAGNSMSMSITKKKGKGKALKITDIFYSGKKKLHQIGPPAFCINHPMSWIE